MIQKQWILNEVPISDEMVLSWSNSLSLHPKLVQLLLQRGYNNLESINSFFSFDKKRIHDPYLLKDMDIAVARITKAITENHKILVYGDYDVDGTTAVSIVFSFLRSLNCNVEYYIPDRYLEGYGVSMKGIEYAKENSFNVIITLDCGIKAIQTIKKAKEYGIDVIICDHHEPALELPPAIAILNPKQKDCEYPCKHLSGCGVAFKLLHALYNTHKKSLQEDLSCYLDLLAVSIASDIVPIIGENRIFMQLGIARMLSKPSVGLRTIMDSVGMHTEITVSDIVFKITPRINAAGRIKDAKTVVELLTATDTTEAYHICELIKEYNITRRSIDTDITEDALSVLAGDSMTQSKKSNVVYSENWHKGVIGIVASRITEKYYKPTVVFCGTGEHISASARSVADFDLYSAIEKCEHLLVNYGGHKYAAGLTIEKSKYQEFSDLFEKVVSESITEEQLLPRILIDIEIPIEDINFEFYNQLLRFEPFGPENMTPVFLIKNVYVSPNTKCVGANKKHVQFKFFSNIHKSTATITGIAFDMADKWAEIQESNDNPMIDVCCVIRKNVFQGQESLQLDIRDFRKSENQFYN